MGRAKRKNIAQTNRSQVLQAKKTEPTKKTKKKLMVEKNDRARDGPSLGDTQFLTELSRMEAITPYALASQFNLRLSDAKDLLNKLEKKRLVEPVYRNDSLRTQHVVAA